MLQLKISDRKKPGRNHLEKVLAIIQNTVVNVYQKSQGLKLEIKPFEKFGSVTKKKSRSSEFSSSTKLASSTFGKSVIFL